MSLVVQTDNMGHIWVQVCSHIQRTALQDSLATIAGQVSTFWVTQYPMMKHSSEGYGSKGSSSEGSSIEGYSRDG